MKKKYYFLIMLMLLPFSIEMAAQNYYLSYGPDPTDGRYLRFIIFGDKGSAGSESNLAGSQEKANEWALKLIESSQYDNNLINLRYDSSNSDSNGVVFVNPTWCTFTFKPDFSSVIVNPHRNTNRIELKLCEYYPLQVGYESVNSNTLPYNQYIINNAHSNNQYNSSSNSTRHFKCAYCNGTGRIERNDNAPASFGQTRANKRCNECGKVYDPTVFNHYHVQCRHCGGTGNAK